MLHQLIIHEQVICSHVLHIHYIPKLIILSTPNDCITDIIWWFLLSSSILLPLWWSIFGSLLVLGGGRSLPSNTPFFPKTAVDYKDKQRNLCTHKFGRQSLNADCHILVEFYLVYVDPKLLLQITIRMFFPSENCIFLSFSFSFPLFLLKQIIEPLYFWSFLSSSFTVVFRNMKKIILSGFLLNTNCKTEQNIVIQGYICQGNIFLCTDIN